MYIIFENYGKLFNSSSDIFRPAGGFGPEFRSAIVNNTWGPTGFELVPLGVAPQVSDPLHHWRSFTLVNNS